MKKVLCIINPNSGTHRQKQNIESTILKYVTAPEFSVEFIYTQYSGHGFEISKNARNNYDIIVAVGGDGTIHEIAQNVIHSSSKLAIIPMGSGNGLARFLGIPLSFTKAAKLISKNNSIKIDTILCNNEYVINVAGIGFDAHIGNVFNSSKTRGGFHYFSIIAKELSNYKCPTYSFIVNNKTITETIFITAIANSSQWGMNAHIAPKAEISDGKFDLVIIKKFPFYISVNLAIKLFTKGIKNSRFVKTMQLENLIITNNNKLLIHLDGETREFTTDVHFEIQKKSLEIIIQ